MPPNPRTQSGQILYLFNSLEIPGSYILQPVLLWGTVSDVPGSGNFWTIASWYVGADGYPFYLTELMRVDPGDELTGRITMYQQEQLQDGRVVYDYTCEFVGKSGTKLFAAGLPLLTDSTETLETYYITSDTDYPATAQTAFTAIALEVGGAPAQFTWTPAGNFPPTVRSGGSEVDIVYPRNET